ncbi:hypothetical protein C7Y71_007230 [Pseudoprevotella muciniphila]|uniref:PD-(D/E)XK nuclease family protein n=1 Tax=Pseudoprevotella muciniphila TaxID=2133944 RepID=A0A5P8E7A3_9BACT|nr:PD-(D/E)XK nuclease family protein [Pseudoprevotella muciniphila]QFQ12826.1 hypothetical protein C7Y71_007230 [Pseudoprevotella muciniphila]
MAQENKSIKDALTLLQDIQLAVEEECKSLLDFVSEFAKRYEEEKRKLPFHLNVIDELHINENAHSRILMKLLCYQNDKGEHEILQSLLEYIQSIKGHPETFNDIIIKNPTITQEEQRIDLWVRDEGYAIIFENKIYNAKDQEEQICRYIKKTKDNNYKEENIYVIYLSQDGIEPEGQTWGNYKDIFKDRYLNLSFRYNILSWLRELVLPNIRYKEDYLKCAIKQYIDYLDGLFDLRTIQKPMIMELNKFIKEKLNLNDKTPQECLESLKGLKEKKDSLQELATVMERLCNEYIQKTADSIIKPELISFLKREDFEQRLKLEEFSFSIDNLEIRVSNVSWKKCHIIVSLEKEKIFGGLRHKDTKDPLSPNELDLLKNRLADWEGSDENDPRWTFFGAKGYFDKEYLNNCSNWSLETWQAFEKGIEKLIQDIYEKCKGIEL